MHINDDKDCSRDQDMYHKVNQNHYETTKYKSVNDRLCNL